MGNINVEELNSQIAAFKEKYGKTKLTPRKLKVFTADAEKILGSFPDPEGETREALGEFCAYVGCDLLMYGDELEPGISYYRKAIELYPGSLDIRWDYYTTLEEIVEDEEYATPELIRDAIDCLKFCIEYCDTPELKQEHYIHARWLDLGRVYLTAKQPEKAVECAKASLELRESESARDLLKEAEKRLVDC